MHCSKIHQYLLYGFCVYLFALEKNFPMAFFCNVLEENHNTKDMHGHPYIDLLYLKFSTLSLVRKKSLRDPFFLNQQILLSLLKKDML